MKRYILPLFLLLTSLSSAQTIAEKKASLNQYSSDLQPGTEEILSQVNRETEQTHLLLKEMYLQALEMHKNSAPECEFETLLQEIQNLKKKLEVLESNWRERTAKEGQDSYGLWHQPDTTLEQLVIDYGSMDYVYLIPPEVGQTKISVDSQLAVPRSAWREMLELILAENGVGIRTLNPYLRQLYRIQENPCGLVCITNNRRDLYLYPPETRIGFILSPNPAEARRAYHFLQKFINLKTTQLHLLGRDIIVLARAQDMIDLLKLYDFVEMNKGDKEYKMITLSKVSAEEMERILQATFEQESKREQEEKQEAGDLRIIPLEGLSYGLFLVGTKEEVKKAEEIIRNVERQLAGGKDKTIYRYTVKHSDPEELANVLSKVYTLMKTANLCFKDGENGDTNITQANISVPREDLLPQELYEENYYQNGEYIVNPAPVQPGLQVKQLDPNQGRDNFIVDPKTGSIIMVLEEDILPKIKELIHKLDVPKKMVQVEILLFEKIVKNENNFGLNLLRIGSTASHTSREGVRWNENDLCKEALGVFQYFLNFSGNRCLPAFDLSYKFLLAQDDVHINSAPSVLTLNQTPARITLVDEISINTGVFEVETAKGVTLKDAFTRSEYGIFLTITPTIHPRDETGEDYDSVTLDTDIVFDTILPGGNPQRPDVARRQIVNQVRIPDGQTVIIGGLRRKMSNDQKESIPFLGELPGIGKLFSTTKLKDNTTEMFMFITPKIVSEPKEDLKRLRQEQLCHRPGDIPFFMAALNEALRCTQEKLFEQTLISLFGRGCDRYYTSEGEYDGR